jgi:hypothetical protein
VKRSQQQQSIHLGKVIANEQRTSLSRHMLIAKNPQAIKGASENPENDIQQGT